ncbi:MAG: GumC family protein [Elainella sp.]
MHNLNHRPVDSQSSQIAPLTSPAAPWLAQATDDWDLRQLLSPLRRRALMISGIVALVMSFTIGTTLGQKPVYEGRFRLLVEPVNANNDAASLAEALSQQPNLASGRGSLDYDTQIQVLRSPELIQKILQALQSRYPDLTYGELVNSLTIARPGETKILDVRYRGNDPEQIQVILNQLAAGYLKYSLLERQTNLRQGIQFIDDQLPGLQNQVDILQAELQQFRQQYNFIDPDSQSSQIAGRATAIEQQRLAIEQELAKAQSYYQTLQQANGSLAALNDASVYQQLIGQLRQVETQIAAELTRFQPQSLNVRVLQEQRQNLIPVLRQEAERVVGSKQADAITQIQILQVRSQVLAAAQTELDGSIKQLPALARRYTDIQRELQIATEGLNRLLANRQTLQVQAAQTEIPWQLIEAPTQPQTPISPNVPRNLLLGFVASSLLGVGAALLLEKLDDVYHSAEDLKEKTKIPLLGTLPYSQHSDELIGEAPELTIGDRVQASLGNLVPRPIRARLRQTAQPYKYYNSYNFSGFSEAMRVLHMNLQFLNTDRPLKSIIISSALPGDGKSTVAINLARTAMVLGQRVLLVDADMRRPQVYERMQLENLQGLSNYISSDIPLKSVLQKPISLFELSVLSAGSLPPDPPKLLASRKMQQLMRELEQSFDLIIYDTPPLLGLADASILAQHTDGIVVVARLGKTSRSAVSQALDNLKQAKIPILGLVANGQRKDIFSSYGDYSYRAYATRNNAATATDPDEWEVSD